MTLAILRWTGAKKAEVTNAQLRSIALERLQRWVGAGVEDSQVTPAPLHSKTRVAFLWDGRAGDHYSGRRAHVVLSVDNGLPVSFDQYRPPDTSVAPKLNAEQGQKAALAALSPFPKDFHQTGIEARLYDHSPLAKDDGPVWAVALNGTKGKDNQRVQAGAVIDAVSGQVLAPKPKAKGK
ncbi:MAG: hypothetical protein HYU66_01635 [Armatimonadetes bacterium]|nr:hypothetical protein [Armatimonadota bacterium]